MKELDIIIKAVKLEAKSKPEEKIFIGTKVFTFKQFADMINNHNSLKREDRKIIKACLNNFVKMFRENKVYRSKMMLLAGVEP